MGVPVSPSSEPSPQPSSSHPSSHPSSDPSSDPPSNPPSHSPSSSPASSLPPEALELASKLFALARGGETSQLSSYLNAGIPPNLTNHKGDTLLMLAAYHGHKETAEMLLDRGADANVCNDRGQSIVAGAVFKGDEGMVRLLVEKGRADVRLGQPNALDAAGMFRQEGILRFLMEGEGGR